LLGLKKEVVMMKLLARWEFFALGAALFAGLTALFGKMGVLNVPSNLATFIRTCVILLLTAVILSLRFEWQRPATIGMKSWIFLVLSGITTGLSWLCYYRALQLGPVSKVASLDKLSIVVAIILGILFLGEKWSWQAAVGAALITLGAVLIAMF